MTADTPSEVSPPSTTALELFAASAPGTEEVVRDELTSLGIDDATVTEGGVGFTGTIEDALSLNLRARTASRILMRERTFVVRRFDRLRRVAGSIPWERYLPPGATVAPVVTTRSSRLYVKARIADELVAGAFGRLQRLGVPVERVSLGKADATTQRIMLRLVDDTATISLDTSGELLHFRGYDKHVAEAPLRETLAAAILRFAGSEGYDLVVDPLCGSGTFSLEEAMARARLPLGAGHPLVMERWPMVPPELAAGARRELEEGARSRVGSSTPRCMASDKRLRAVEVASHNVRAAGLEGLVTVRRHDFLASPLPLPPDRRALVVINPPMGKRMGSTKRGGLFGHLGAVLRDWYPTAGFAIIVPGVELERRLGLSYDRKLTCSMGGIGVGVLVKDAPVRGL